MREDFYYSQGKMVESAMMLPQGSGWKSISPRCITDQGLMRGLGRSETENYLFFHDPHSVMSDRSIIEMKQGMDRV